MLRQHPITPRCWPPTLPQPASAITASPGCRSVREDENAIVFRCGGGTHLDVTKSTAPTAGQQGQGSMAGQRHPRRGSRTPRPPRPASHGQGSYPRTRTL
jgi:hypothetical protein